MNSVSDNDWKQSVGFPINYNSDQSSDENFEGGDVVVRRHHAPRSSQHLLADGGDGAVADLLGTTPPRARIRNKEKRRTDLMDSEGAGVVHKPLQDRRYTTDNLYHVDTGPDTPDRVRKRASLKVSRARDRDWKQDATRAEHRADSLPSPQPAPRALDHAAAAAPTLVESCSRFMSLTSRLKCRAGAGAGAESAGPRAPPPGELPASRVDFHSTFSLLISMGAGDRGARRAISREEQVWQNELKDLIWLELQAKIAGRSLARQDAVLCAQRGIVPTLIRNIMEYRFINTSPCKYRTHTRARHADGSQEDTNGHLDGHDAHEEYCLEFECSSCSTAVGKALREVGTLLDSFYNAVSLYPSSKAMTIEHPLVATLLFNNRLKAMCLWYNIALHMRMKIMAVRKLFRTMQEKNRRSYEHLTSLDSDCSGPVVKPCLVRFNLQGNPSDSNNSDSSSLSDSQRGDAGEGLVPPPGERGDASEGLVPPPGERGDASEGQASPTEDYNDCNKETDEVDNAREKADALSGGSGGLTPEVVVGGGGLTPEVVIGGGGPTGTSDTSESGYSSDRGGGSARRDPAPPSPPEDVYNIGSLDELTSLCLLNKCDVSPYRTYLDEILKTQGVRRSMMFIQKLRKYILQKVYMTFEKPDSVCSSEPYAEEPLSAEVFVDTKEPPPVEEPPGPPDHHTDELAKNNLELRRYGCWSAESRAMRLPSYRSHFLLLSAVSMELVHDYLALRLDSRPEHPSCLTIHQMIHELKEGIDIATDIRAVFVKNIEVTLEGYSATHHAKEQLLLVIRTFDATVENVLKQYLSYLQTLSAGKHLPRAMLHTEWTFTARLAKRVACVAVLAPVSFTEIMCSQLERLRRQFEERFDEFSKREEHYPGKDDDAEVKRHFVYALCREAHCIYACDREPALQTVQFARVLALRLARAPPPAFRDQREMIFNSMMSLRECIVQQTRVIVDRSNVLPAEMSRDTFDNIVARLRELLLQVYRLGFELHKELYRYTHPPLWSREEAAAVRARPASLQPAPRAAPRPRPRRRPDTVLVRESLDPLLIHKELHRFVNNSAAGRCGAPGTRRRSPGAGTGGGAPRPRPGLLRLESTGDDVDDRLFEDDHYVISQKQSSIEMLLSAGGGGGEAGGGGEGGACAAEVETRGAAQLEYTVEEQWAKQVARAIIQFAKCWMRFVTQRCDRGRGLRPRWANQGLEFLMLACDPYNTKHLTDTEFEELKHLMDECISHVIGSRPPCARAEPAAPSPAAPRRHRHRLNSPLPGGAQSGAGKDVPTPPTPPPSEPDPVLDFHGIEHTAYSRRVQEATARVDAARDRVLRAGSAVGRVLESTVTSYEPKLRQVTFKWQRGLKIGAGTFGKVYTVINTETSQLLAMKEISIGAGDRRAMRRAANELRVLEGVIHPHLVRYYGCELHREEMLIFMELCVEGSLEALVASSSGGLPEHAVRNYTKQLVSAVAELHHRKIAHRDIKSGNVFLTNEGHCLKLGDFGCAVKIRANSTALGELQGTVGTQAYMAPEVFMKSSGHGRAADVWSLGCVVTEMASGKRPFSESDSNYQIMFMVGMGGRPAVPDTLSAEGRAFCLSCLTHEPDQRPTAHQLTTHHFLMVKADEECNCEPGYFIAKI